MSSTSVRKTDEKAVKADLHAVMNAATATKVRSAARRFAARWGKSYSAAVACLSDDLDELLTCFGYKMLAERKTLSETARAQVDLTTGSETLTVHSYD